MIFISCLTSVSFDFQRFKFNGASVPFAAAYSSEFLIHSYCDVSQSAAENSVNRQEIHAIPEYIDMPYVFGARETSNLKNKQTKAGTKKKHKEIKRNAQTQLKIIKF